MLTRTQFSDFFLTTMKPALELVIGDNYRRWPKQWTKIFRQESTRQSIWQSTTVAGTGLATTIGEGQPVIYDNPVQGFDKTFTPVRYGLGIQITQDVQDTTPAEWIEAVLVHPGWELIRERMDLMINRRRAELEQLLPPERTAFMRGEIAALRTCLSLPAILKKELEAQPK